MDNVKGNAVDGVHQKDNARGASGDDAHQNDNASGGAGQGALQKYDARGFTGDGMPAIGCAGEAVGHITFLVIKAEDTAGCGLPMADESDKATRGIAPTTDIVGEAGEGASAMDHA